MCEAANDFAHKHGPPASTASTNRNKEYDFWIRGQRQVLPHFCRRHDLGLLIIRCHVQRRIDDLRAHYPQDRVGNRLEEQLRPKSSGRV